MQTAGIMRGNEKAYTTLKDDQVVLMHPSTIIDYKPEFVMYNEFMLTSKSYIRTLMVIDPEWLFEVAPDYFQLDEFPTSEVKRKLERVQKKMEAKKLALKEAESKKSKSKKL